MRLRLLSFREFVDYLECRGRELGHQSYKGDLMALVVRKYLYDLYCEEKLGELRPLGEDDE